MLEALVFSARLRLPGDISKSAVRAYVDNVIEMVELEDGAGGRVMVRLRMARGCAMNPHEV